MVCSHPTSGPCGCKCADCLAVAEERATTGRLRVDVTPEAVEALRLAAENMPLRREGEPYAGAANWLKRRAAGFEDALNLRAALASPGGGD